MRLPGQTIEPCATAVPPAALLTDQADRFPLSKPSPKTTSPSLALAQAIGRWGNYFNQELYGPPTDAPWGIPIDCAHRLAVYACDVLPETTRFHSLFLYESISGLVGAAVTRA